MALNGHDDKKRSLQRCEKFLFHRVSEIVRKSMIMKPLVLEIKFLITLCTFEAQNQRSYLHWYNTRHVGSHNMKAD